MMYCPSSILQLPYNIYLVLLGLLLAGITNAHLVIPPMDEMIEAGMEQYGLDTKSDALSDACSGLFNMSFATGEILGPLIGNLLYTNTNFIVT